MVALLPYSILTHFVNCRCRVGGFKIAPLASGGTWYTDCIWRLALTPCLLLHIFLVKKFICIQFYAYLVLLMDSIQCICLFSLDVHFHMLVSKTFWLVTWPWAVSHPRHQQTDKAKGKDAYVLLLVCLPEKYPRLFIHLWHGEYVDVICNAWFAVHKKYQQVWARRRT